MLQVEVLRPISGLEAKVGEVVDASQWTALRELERQGFVQRFAQAAPPQDAPRKREGVRT